MIVPTEEREITVYREHTLNTGVIVQIASSRAHPSYYELRYVGSGVMPKKYRGIYTTLRAANADFDMFLLSYLKMNSKSVVEAVNEETGEKIFVNKPFNKAKKDSKTITEEAQEISQDQEDLDECQEVQQ